MFILFTHDFILNPPNPASSTVQVLTPAALTFFVSYADGAVESLWSIDQYFDFVLVLMLSTGLSFQVGRESETLRQSFIFVIVAFYRCFLCVSAVSAAP